ncbi:unnamed protein product, partial [Meganyctiphanes norvegica]
MSKKVNLKVVMLGNTACGKTSLVERYIYKRFNNNYQATIGAAFGARKVSLEGRQLCLGVWDTAGSERYQAMSRIYYRDAKAAIICYDITDAECISYNFKYLIKAILENTNISHIFNLSVKISDQNLRQTVNTDKMETKDGTAKKLCTLPYHIQLNVYTQFQAILRQFIILTIIISMGNNKN